MERVERFSNVMERRIFIFFGPPGSGKGTQALLLGEKLNLPVISTGELFRREEELDTNLGKKVKKITRRGGLVPDGIVAKIIKNRIAEKDARKGFILDGYPRTKRQFGFLSEIVKEKMVFIFINVSDKEVKKRLGERRACKCGEVYHLTFKKPKTSGICDSCGGTLFIRKDDRKEVIARRLKIYHAKTEPLIEYAGKAGKVFVMDGEEKIQEIKKDILKRIKNLYSSKR